MDRKWLVFTAVGVGAFMSALDSSIVNTILPVVTSALKSDVASIEWVVTVYLLVISGLLLTFGRLGDLRGNRTVYLLGFVVFISGSALCGLSPSAWALVGFRALQAVGAAMLYSNTPAILTKNFPAEQRGQALGMQAMMTYIGLSVGPSLGGWLSDVFTWRAVFYINVPICMLALGLSLRYIPVEKLPEHGERFDTVGAATFTAGLVALLLALNQGHEWGWASLPVLGSAFAAVILLAAFLRIELHVKSPMLDLSLFGNRLFSASTLSAVLNYMCLYSVLFLLPFYLIQGRGLNAAQAGLVLTAQPLLMAVSAPLSGTLSDRIGSRLPGTLGMAIQAVGLFTLSRVGATAPYSMVVLGLAITGLGMGFFSSPNNSALMGAAPRHRQGIASGVLATARNVGMVLGVGLAGAVFTTILPNDTGLTSSPLLFQAVDAGLAAATVLAILGAFTSAIRGGGAEQERQPAT